MTEPASDGWRRKFKGSNYFGGAWIYTHPALKSAVVEDVLGISYGGKKFNSVKEAKMAALKGGAA